MNVIDLLLHPGLFKGLLLLAAGIWAFALGFCLGI